MHLPSQAYAIQVRVRDGVITHGQRGTNRPPPGAGGSELWVKGLNLGIMAKVSYGSMGHGHKNKKFLLLSFVSIMSQESLF